MAQLVKLNSFEQAIVVEGLKAVKQSFSEDIALAKAEGKTHLFSDEFIDDTINNICVQLGIKNL